MPGMRDDLLTCDVVLGLRHRPTTAIHDSTLCSPAASGMKTSTSLARRAQNVSSHLNPPPPFDCLLRINSSPFTLCHRSHSLGCLLSRSCLCSLGETQRPCSVPLRCFPGLRTPTPSHRRHPQLNQEQHRSFSSTLLLPPLHSRTARQPIAGTRHPSILSKNHCPLSLHHY